MYLADLVQGASHTVTLQHCSMGDMEQKLVDAVKGWGQELSWQIEVLEVLGTKSTEVKLLFIGLSPESAVREANKLLEQGEHSSCHGDLM
jgi:hypothetical protein